MISDEWQDHAARRAKRQAINQQLKRKKKS
jgi:hypothetical protein